jgi:K+-sensing histidine kinase KdpD
MATALGTVGVLATGALLIPFRETVGAVGVALAMALLVVLAAEFGGRTAGVVVGIVASLTFNVLHTRPYYALVIDHPPEAVAAGLLAVMGFIIGTWHRTRPGS